MSKIKYLDLFIFISIIFVTGLRWDVGGDWARYTEYLDFVLTDKAPNESGLYYILNVLFNLFKLDVLGKNIVLSILFLVPFFYIFKKFYQNIYLALCIFFPIIFIVYGLGSIRQGLAMSYFFLFIYYDGNKFLKFLIFLVPFFFHPASLVLYISYIASKVIKLNNRKVFFITSFIVLTFVSILVILAHEYILVKISNYIVKDTYSSIGAPIRAIILSFFSIIFLIKFKRLKIKNKDMKNFILFSSLLIIFLTLFSYHLSTAVDRILGFFLILKLMIANEIIKNSKIKSEKKFYSIIFIIISYLYLVAWIFLGSQTFRWLRFELPFI
ncbi:EpsG family protein [Candidatus Pelagibacter sp.]|nr:EpsG family protein [Candidatus Pelagibacter sp.]